VGFDLLKDILTMEYYEDYDDLAGLPKIKNMPDPGSRRGIKVKPKDKNHSQRHDLAEIYEQGDEISEYNFSYDASRHEREWILNSLGTFHDMQWFSDILRLVKGGKEASVYQCLPSPNSPIDGNFLAAKVYRPRRFRNLRNDHLYREGRAEFDESGLPIVKEKMVKAIRQKSDYGREIMHTSWLEHEYRTMHILHAAGADVPVPYAGGKNAILMEFIGDGLGAAPTLNSIRLEQHEAKLLFQRVLFNIELMLAHEKVHADLSAFNILYWEGEIKLIDFPQSISPHENQSAYIIFERDMRRICEYFARQGVNANFREIAKKLWQTYKYREIPKFNLEYLDEEDEADRDYWARYKDK
jgi:RIO kinase 1